MKHGRGGGAQRWRNIGDEAAPVNHGTVTLLDRTARTALFLTLGVPLYLAPGFFFPFVSVRGLIFRALVAVAGVCVLLRTLTAERTTRGDRDWTLIALVALLATNALSAALGYSWQRSVFGTFARLGGVWTLAHLVMLYALLRTAFEERHWRWYLRGIVIVGLLAAAYGLLQRYQLELGISWEGAPNPPNGPLGNYGIFGGYLLFPIAAACYLAAAETRTGARRASIAALVPLLWVLWLTTNRSGILGLLCGVVSASVLYSWFSGRGRRLAATAVIAGIALVLIVAGMRPGRPLASLAASMPHTIQRFTSVSPLQTGVDRRMQWKAATLAARDRPLLGYGPENHEIVWSMHFDPAIYALTEDQLYDRTHNAYFEALGTTGILGFAALLLLWAAVIAAIEARRRAGLLSSAEAAVLLGINVAYALYLWFWFFDLTAMAVWIGLAAFVSSRGRPPPFSLSGERPWRSQSVAIGGATMVVGAVLIWTYSISPLIEARRLGRLQERTDTAFPTPLAALQEFRVQLQSTSPYATAGTILFSRYLSAIRPEFPRLREDAAFVRELAPTLEQSLIAIERARAADPLNDRLMTVKTRIMIRASQFYGSPEIAARAEATAREAVALGPRRVSPRLILASLLAAEGRHEEAFAQADSALLIHPRSADAHGVRASIFLAVNQVDSAAAELLASMPPVNTTGFAGPPPPRTDPGVVLRVAFALAERGDTRGGADLLRHYMIRWYGGFSEWSRGTVGSLAVVRLDRAAASILPVLEIHSGNTAGAGAAALGFATICRPAAPAVIEFISYVGNQDRAPGRYRRSIVSRSEDLEVVAADVLAACEPLLRQQR